MKKILYIIPMILILILIAAPVASASMIYVVDDAGILTQAQVDSLNDRASRISNEYKCIVAIHIVNDMYDFTGVTSADRLNRAVYNTLYGGADSAYDCVILCLSMKGRDYSLWAYEDARTAFTEYGINKMLDDHILPPLGRDNFNAGFTAYLDRSEEYLRMARDGTPFDTKTDPETKTSRFVMNLTITILVPLIIAFIICAIWKGQMKTAKLAKTADNYIPPGGFRLTNQSDTFLYRTTSRVKIEKSSSSSSGFSSSGSSHGRSGKF